MKIKSLIAVAVLTLLVVANYAEATPNCQKCPYSCSDLGLGKKDCSIISVSGGICCLDLTQKGLEIAAARAAVSGNSGSPGSNASRGHGCPSGFRPGPKCTQDQRRRGCKDLRGSNGESCNNR